MQTVRAPELQNGCKSDLNAQRLNDKVMFTLSLLQKVLLGDRMHTCQVADNAVNYCLLPV